MGMVVSLASVSDATIARLLEAPPLVWQVFAPDDPEAFARALEEVATPAPLSLGDGEGEIGDIDKAWHGVHYLLTGTADEGDPPLNFLVAGGTDVGDDDVGYGPPRVYRPAEVREIAAALAAVSDDELRRRFDPPAMMRAEIYPGIWDRDPADDDTLEYLMGAVADLRVALATVTSNGHGLLVILS
jgi:hypothetical protein